MMKKTSSSFLLYAFALFFAYSLFFVTPINAQGKADSLKHLLKKTDEPVAKAKILLNLSKTYIESDVEKALKYINEGIETLDNKSDSLLAVSYDFRAGVYQRMTGKGKEAISDYLSALRLAKKIEDSLLIGRVYFDFGVFNIYHGDPKLAEKYFLNCKAYSYEKSNARGKTNILMSLSFIYSNAHDSIKADEVLSQAYFLSLQTKEKQLIAVCASNLAENKWTIGQQDSAIIYIKKALELNEEIDYKLGIAWCNYVYGGFYFKQKNFRLADKYFSKSIKIWESINSYKDLAMYGYEYYSDVKAKLGDYKSAFEIIKKLMAVNDTISSQRNAEFLTEMEKKYQAEKDSLSLLALNLKLDKEKIKSEKSRQSKRRLIVFFSIIGVILMANAIYFFIRLKATRRTNKIIEEQNVNLEMKNKEISDSITYAKRIQEAILPSRFSLSENLTNGFVLFKPKDIVSGDFYWLEKIGNATYFAAADCTGHGVPGAMVSVVCANALSKALLEENITETGKLLDRTRELVVEKFQNSDEEVKDGMDISLCKLEGNKLQWSGANNPLWIIRNSDMFAERSRSEHDRSEQNNNKMAERSRSHLIEVKPNKQSIGKTDQPEPFTSHNIELQQGDSIYIFTDGYADQFGGETLDIRETGGKKFKAGSFKNLLLSIQNESMGKQKELIGQAFENWKGDLEQIDDVCVIGVRL